MFLGAATRARLTERLRRLFGGNPRRVQAAALPWRRMAGKDGEEGALEVMLVTSRDTGRWVLPKGWPEGEETLADAAIREAREEAGVEGEAGLAEAGRFYYDKRREDGVPWPCEVAVIALRVKVERKKWPEKDNRTRRWFSPAEAASLVDEPDLAELLAELGDNPREIAA